MNITYELARLGTGYFLKNIQERYRKGLSIPPPRYILWDSTRLCNLHCIHCGASKERYSQELDSAQVELLLDELAAMKIGMFGVTGGEPFLRKDLFAILDYANHLGIKTGVATNGYTMDLSQAQRCRDIGIHSIQVSLDGDETTHNNIRGDKLSYKNAITALQHLMTVKIPVITVATTFSRCNIDQLDHIKNNLDDLGVRLWKISVVMPIGRAQAQALALDQAQLARVMQFVEQNKSNNLQIAIGENLPFLGEYERRLRKAPLICPIGFTACCIGVDGTVRGCPEQVDSQENREGSILENTFASIWDQGFRRYREREILSIDTRCKSCRDQEPCYGGCWVMRKENQHCIKHLLQ